MKTYDIILASASPRRIELIKQISGINARVVPSNADESAPPGLESADLVMYLAQKKASEVFSRTGGIVLGADTLVFLDSYPLLKPRDKAEAEKMFLSLSGKTHEVITGICVVSENKIVKNFEKTYVTFGAFNGEIVYNYINSGKPFDKAGGYGIQDTELKPLIKHVAGDFSNVVGLPLKLTEKTLKEILKESF